MIRKLVFLSALLAFVVVVFGAYVRLSDAGLGCPDWPGCYGKLSPHHAQEEILAAQSLNQYGPVSLPKAWKEMIHRYLASTLGCLIVAMCVLAWRRWRRERAPALMYLGLLGLVCIQGAFGAWTVTLRLMPAVVSTHLLLGLTTLGALAWVAQREFAVQRFEVSRGLMLAARIGLVLLVLQIALGGWVSTNYAALICPDFPTCQNQWLPNMDFQHAFVIGRDLGRNADGSLFPAAAQTAIHWSHRVGAVLVGSYLLVLAWCLWRAAVLRRLVLLLIAAVCAQITLGISNVVFGLPLAVAVAHNAVAALLVVTMVSLNLRLDAKRVSAQQGRNWHERLAH